MSRKLFVFSDIHSFYDELITALNNAGFDENNPEHILVCCGDFFDRGPKPIEVYKFLKRFNDIGRAILIRGNHEDLFFDAYYEFKECGYVYSYHHKHNGTNVTMNKLFNERLDEEVLNWIYDKSVNYFETDHYIFVHGWIPCTEYDKWENPTTIKYQPNWRKSDKWESARWLNGMKMWKQGIIEPGKTIVCGHFHCGYGNLHYHDEMTSEKDEDDQYYLSDHPFIDENIIALDACTVLTKKINVVVLED